MISVEVQDYVAGVARRFVLDKRPRASAYEGSFLFADMHIACVCVRA